jgi:proteasome lid subunit RPN8/RPN11
MFLSAAREHVVGWYSTGPRLREADLSMHQLMTNYCSNPVLVICEVEVRQMLCCTSMTAQQEQQQQQHES